VTAPVTEIGYGGPSSGAQGWWDAPDVDETPELRWPASVRVFDAMRRQDAQVKSVLRAVTLPVRRTPWRVDPAGARDEVVQLVAQDLGLPVAGQAPIAAPRTRDRFSWSEHLRHALLALPFGHMFFEQVYRIDPAGRARLRKLAPRMPRTLQAIHVAQDGGLVSIEQAGPGVTGVALLMAGGPIVIPVSRLVAYVPDREAGNWLGESLLRSAYKNWLVKDRLLRVQAQTIERNGMGVPVYEGAEEETDLTVGTNLAKNLRSGATAGAGIPHGAKLLLQGVQGALPNADTAIRYHDEQIARAVLAHFLNLGTQTGSWALGSTFADFFTLSLQTVAEYVRDVANAHIVEDLVDLNFGPDEPAPQIVFDEIGSQARATADAIKQLIDSGALFPDRALEEYLRQVYGLPAKSDFRPPADPTAAGGAA
jgi:hypothetical protein